MAQATIPVRTGQMAQHNLIPMDRAVLSFLLEQGGSVPTIAIPARMFTGEIPEGLQDLVDMGLIEHIGEITSLTMLGRKVAASLA